jgi:hypothetical protein
VYELKYNVRIENLLEFNLFIKAAGNGIYQLSYHDPPPPNILDRLVEPFNRV